MAGKKGVCGRRPRPEEDYEKLAKDLLDFVKQDNVIHLSQWSESKEKTQGYINRLAERSETFRQALDRARYIIGMRWLGQSFNGKISGPFAMHKPGMYLKDIRQYWQDNYRDQERIRAEAAAEIAAAKERGEQSETLDRVAQLLKKLHDASAK